MEVEPPANDSAAEHDWQPPVDSSAACSIVSSPGEPADFETADKTLEAALLDEDEGDDFVGFSPQPPRPQEEAVPEPAAVASGWSSGESLPGSPGDLVIAESGSEAEGRGRRATSAAPSTASDGSSASSRSRSKPDLTLPIYKKPFDFGFKREIVYRSFESRSNCAADIYYHPPTAGKKLRSTIDVARYLAENELPIPLESFSFSKEAVGMNDTSLEFTRYANSANRLGSPFSPKVASKRPTPVQQKPVPKVAEIKTEINGGPTRAPKRARKSTFQDPVWLTTDNKKGSLAPCGIHCLKAAGQVPSLQCSSCVCLYHPVCVGLTQLDSSILHGYVCTNCRPQKPAPVPKAPPPVIKVPQKAVKTKQKAFDGSGESVQALAVLDGRQFVVVPKGPHLPPPAPPPEGALPAGRPTPAEPQSSAAPSRPLPTSFSTDLAARMSALLHVFSFLTVKELLRVSRVSSSWRLLAENRALWRNVRLKNSGVRSWTECSEWLSRHCTEAVDMRKMLLPPSSDWWGEAAHCLNQVSTLRSMEMSRCSGISVGMVAAHCSHLEALSAASIAPDVEVNLDQISKSHQLKRLRLRGANLPIHPIHLPSLQRLQRLTALSITNASPLPGEDVAQVLNALPNLELLELGECADMVQNAEILTEVIAKLQKLKRLRLEHLVSQQHNAELLVTFYESLTVLPRLQHLELVHVEAPPGCDLQLARIAPLRTLLLLPSFAHQGSVSSQVLLRGVSRLVGLRRLVIGLTSSICETAQQLHLQKVARVSPQQSPYPQPNEDCLPVAAPVPLGPAIHDPQSHMGGKLDGIEILPAWHLRRLLMDALPYANVDVRRLSHPSRYTLEEWPIHSV